MNKNHIDYFYFFYDFLALKNNSFWLTNKIKYSFLHIHIHVHLEIELKKIIK